MVRDPRSTDAWSLRRVCQAEPGIGGARLQAQLGCATGGRPAGGRLRFRAGILGICLNQTWSSLAMA